MTKIHFPQFSREDYSPFEMRQLIQALELRFQQLESNIDTSLDTTGGVDGSGGEFAPVDHTHREDDIINLAHTTSIFALDDVSPGITNGQGLIWNDTLSTFVAGDVGGSGGGGATNLNDLFDVNVPSPNDEDVLTWDSSSGQWIAQAPDTGGVVGSNTLVGLDDTLLTGASQYDLFYNSGSNIWRHTGADFRWYSNDKYVRFAKDATVRWLDESASTITMLEFAESGAPAGVTPDPDIGTVTFLAAFEEPNATAGNEVFTPDIDTNGVGNITWNITSGTQPTQVDAEISTTQVKYGAQSLYAKESAGAPSASWSSGTIPGSYFSFTGDFTVECDIYIVDNTSEIPICGSYVFGEYQWKWTLEGGSGRMGFTFGVTDTTTSAGLVQEAWGGGVAGVPSGAWHHIAVCREGSTWYAWLDGVLSDGGTNTVATAINIPTTTNFNIFSVGPNLGANQIEVYMDNLRITDGVARYTTAFTPPTGAHDDGSTGAETFVVGDPAYPTHIDGTKVELENNIGINWDDGAGTDVEHLVFANTFVGGTPETDPNIGNVIFLATMEGQTATRPASFAPDIGSAGIIEYFTKVGAGDFMEIRSDQAIFGERSLYMSGATGATSGCYMYSDMVTDTAWQFGTGDFTMECHFWLVDTVSNNFQILGNRNFSSQNCFNWYLNSDMRINGFISVDGNNFIGVSQAGSINQITENDGWHHLVFQRFGANLEVFLDGNRLAQSNIGAGASMFVPTVSSYRTRVMIAGSDGDLGDSEYYLDNIRVTAGVARYQTASFTPPSAPYDGSPGELAFVVGDTAYPTQIDGTTTTITGAAQLDTTLNVDGISTLNNDVTITTTLDDATGDEVALQLDYTTNKATSGADTGFQMNMTDTLSPGTSLFADYQLGGVSLFDWGIDGTYRIYDLTGADSAAFSHDGTDFNTTFTGTTDWNITGFTGGVGIGTSAPENTLHVQGGALVTGRIAVGNYTDYPGGTLYLNAGNTLIRAAVTNDQINLMNSANDNFIASFGNIDISLNRNTGIFILDPLQPLDVVGTVRMRDSGATDWADFSHDGTDFNTAFTNTAAWNISGANVEMVGGITQSFFSGGLEYFYSANNLLYTRLRQENSRASIFSNDITNVMDLENWTRWSLRDGATFEIRDSTDTDIAAFSHDGTDFSTAFTTTVDWDITGLTGEVFIDAALRTSGDLTVGGTTTTINSNVVSIADNIILLNSDATDPPTENAGLEIYRGGVVNNPFFLWNETNDSWEFVNPAGETIGDFRGSGTGRQLLIPFTSIAAATPSIAFGDGDTGFHEFSDDILRLSIGGNVAWEWGNNYFGRASGSRVQLLGEVSSNTNPVVLPWDTDATAGLGGNVNEVSLIAGGVDGLTIKPDGNHTLSSILDEATGDEIALDLSYTVNKLTSGADTGLRLNVTETSSPGTSLFAEFVAGGVTKFSWSTNPAFTIYDNTGVDSAVFNHDGTDFNTTFTTTSDWRISGLTAELAFDVPVVSFENDAQIRVYDNSNTGYMRINNFGTYIQYQHVAPVDTWFITDLNQVWLRDGATFRISDSLDTDYAEFQHDGIDFNTTFTNTTDWNITGLTGFMSIDADDFRMLGNLATATPPTTEAVNFSMWWYDSDGTDALARIGFQGSSQFRIQNMMHGQAIELRGVDSGGVARTVVSGNPNNIAALHYAGNVVMRTTPSGIETRTNVGDLDTDSSYVSFNRANGTLKGQVGIVGNDGWLRLSNTQDGYGVEINADDALNVNQNLFVGDPDGSVDLYFDGTATARTLAAASGGLEANNTLTGGGFERVLTASDIGGGGIPSGTTTDAVLRWSGSAWVETTLLQINDPAGNHSLTSVLDADTGNEVALALNYTTNKLTSGDDTGFQINMTDTASPGTSLLAEYNVGGVTKFSWSANPTFTMYDNTGADSAAFNHDGTDFNTAFTNTTDWNISGITNADFEAGAALRFYDSTDARTFTISRQLNEINLVASEAGDTMKFSGCQNYEYNKDVSGNTDVIIGEPSTVYAANSTAFISLYGESSSTKYGARFQVGGDTMVLLNAYGNMSHFLCGLPFEVNGHVYVRDGSAFRIYNSFDTDYAEFSHDGTDFNTAFTNTADWNITGLTGQMYVQVPLTTEGGRITFSFSGAEGQIIGNVERIGIFTPDSLSADTSRMQFSGGVDIANINVTDSIMRFGGNSLTGYTNDSYTTQTFALDFNAATFTLYDQTGADSAAFSHDGTDFNTDFINTSDWNVTGAGDLNFDSGTNAKSRIQIGPQVNRGDQADGELHIIGENSGTRYGASIGALGPNLRILPDISGAAGAYMTGMIFGSNTNTWSTITYLGGSTIDYNDGSVVRIKDAGDNGILSMSHDGTDFDFSFTQTREAKFSGLTLDDATGNETAMSLAYTVNKATSGDDTGFLINKTDTLSQGVSRLLDVQVGGVTQFNVQDDGVTNLGNFSFDTDQAVGVGQDNYVLTYDDALGTIQLEAASGGGPAAGTVTNSMLRWSGSAWVEDTRWRLDGSGALTVYDATFADTMSISHDGNDVLLIPSVNTLDLMIGDEVGSNSQWSTVKIPGGGAFWVYDVTPSTHGVILGTTTSNGSDFGTITPLGAGGIVLSGDNFYFSTGGNTDRFVFSRTQKPNGTIAKEQSIEFRTDNTSIGFDHVWRNGSISNQNFEIDLIQQDAIGAGTIYFQVLDGGLPRFRIDMTDALPRPSVELWGGAQLRIRNSLNADYADFYHDDIDFNTDFTQTADWNITSLTGSITSDAPLKILEAAAAVADSANYGQVWVKNDTPNAPYFTGDDGRDWPLKQFSEQEFNYNSTTTSGDPGLQTLRFNSLTPASITEMYIDEESVSEDWLWIISNLADGDIITVKSTVDSADYLVASVNGSTTDNTGWWTVPLTIIHSGSIFTDSDTVRLSVQWFSQAGSGGITGTVANDQIVVGTGTSTVDSDANLTWNGTTLALGGAGKQLLLNGPETVPTAPTIGFGGGDTGFYERGADILAVSVGGAEKWNWNGNAFHSFDSLGGGLLNETTSATNPTLVPRRASTQTGIGANGANELSLIANSIEMVRLVEGADDYALHNTPILVSESSAAVPDQTAYGQVWVRDSAPNTLMFTDDTGVDYPVAGVAAVQTKVKTAEETRTSNNTFTDDNHLSGFALEAGAYYRFEMLFSYQHYQTPDFKYRFQFSNVPQNESGFYYAQYNPENTLNAEQQFARPVLTTGAVVNATDAFDIIIRIVGFVLANATTGGTLDFQWAQNTSDAQTITARKGSFMRVEKIG